MNNRIKGPESGGIDPTVNRSVDKLRQTAPVGTATSNAQPAPGDRVSITGTAVQLSTLQQAISKLPEIDQARVERVRQSLAKGEFAADASKIADRLLQLEGDLAAAEHNPPN